MCQKARELSKTIHVLPKGQSKIKGLLLAKNRAIKALKRVVFAVDLNIKSMKIYEFIMILKKTKKKRNSLVTFGGCWGFNS